MLCASARPRTAGAFAKQASASHGAETSFCSAQARACATSASDKARVQPTPNSGHDRNQAARPRARTSAPPPASHGRIDRGGAAVGGGSVGGGSVSGGSGGGAATGSGAGSGGGALTIED